MCAHVCVREGMCASVPWAWMDSCARIREVSGMQWRALHAVWMLDCKKRLCVRACERVCEEEVQRKPGSCKCPGGLQM